MDKSTSSQPATDSISPLLKAALVQACSRNPVRHEPPNEVDRLALIACTSFADSSLTRAYLRMMEEERADTLKTLGQPTTPPKRDAAAGSIQASSPQTFSPKPIKFSGITSSDLGPYPLCGLHILADDGEFEIETPELTDVQNELVDGTEEKLTSLMMHGLAAVAIRIQKPGQNDLVHVSGFRVGRDAIVTCAHFLSWPDNKEEFQRLALEYHQQAFGMQCALQVREIKTPHTLNRRFFDIRLSAVHRSKDFAVFQILDRPKNDSKNKVIDPCQLVYATDLDQQAIRNAKLCWTVGYNLAVAAEHFEACWRQFYKQQSRDVKIKIAKAWGDQPPNISVLTPDIRTVAFGRVKERDAAVGEPELAAHQEHVDMSAWYGRSGSMFCAYDRAADQAGNNSVDRLVRICGIVSGGHPESPYNLVNLFTPDLEPWLTNAIGAKGDVNEADVDTRFVM